MRYGINKKRISHLLIRIKSKNHEDRNATGIDRM